MLCFKFMFCMCFMFFYLNYLSLFYFKNIKRERSFVIKLVNMQIKINNKMLNYFVVLALKLYA